MSLDLLTHKKFFQFGIPKTEYIPLECDDIVLAPLYGRDIQVNELIDGTSATYYSVLNPRLNGTMFQSEFFRSVNTVLSQFSLGLDLYCESVCSRNRDLSSILPENRDVVFHEIEKKYTIFNNIRKTKRSLAVQGIIYGEKLQGNPLGITGHDFAAIGIFDVDRQISLPYFEVRELCRFLKIPLLPELYSGRLNLHTFFELRDFSRGIYENGERRKGVVIMFADDSATNKILAIKTSNTTRRQKVEQVLQTA